MEMIFELSTDVTQATLALLSLRDRSPSERQLSEVDTLQPRLTPTPPDDLVNVQHRLAIQIIPLGFIQFDDINRLALVIEHGIEHWKRSCEQRRSQGGSAWHELKH